MDAVDSLRPDSILEDSEQLSTETPRQDPQRLCTRTTPCHQQGCMICVTPTNHVRNLDEALNNNNNPRTLPIAADRSPPADLAIVNLTNCFQIALREKTLDEIQPLNEFYLESLKSNPEFHQYDSSELRAIRQTSLELLNSHIAASTPLPASPTNGLVPAGPISSPSASFKPPQTGH